MTRKQGYPLTICKPAERGGFPNPPEMGKQQLNCNCAHSQLPPGWELIVGSRDLKLTWSIQRGCRGREERGSKPRKQMIKGRRQQPQSSSSQNKANLDFCPTQGRPLQQHKKKHIPPKGPPVASASYVVGTEKKEAISAHDTHISGTELTTPILL